MNKNPNIPQNNMPPKSEFKRGPLRFIGKHWLPHNPILKLTQHPTIKTQLYSNIL